MFASRYLLARRIAKVRTPFDGPMPSPQRPEPSSTTLARCQQTNDAVATLQQLVQAADDAKESLVYLEHLNQMYSARLKAGRARQATHLRRIHDEKSDEKVKQWAQRRLLDAGPSFYMREAASR